MQSGGRRHRQKCGHSEMSKRSRFYEEVERMRIRYDKFPSDRLVEIIRRGTIKEYVAADKAVMKERSESRRSSK